MRQVANRILLGLAGAALAGCGINALRTEYAGTVGTGGASVAAASSEFLRGVETSRRLANIEMMAADAACATSSAMVRERPLIARKGSGWLCVPPAEAGSAPAQLFVMRPLANELQPTVLLVSSLSAYTQAVAAAVDSKPADPMKPLLDALATARSAQGLLLALSGGKDGPVPAADDKRIAAVGDFVGFLAGLANEADQVSRLRQLILSRPDGAAPLIDTLQARLRSWEGSRKGDDMIRVGVNGALLRRTLDATPPAPVAERREALTSFYEVQDSVAASNAIYPALSAALAELRESDANLRRVLAERPNLTRAERAEVAETNRQRAIKAIDSLTALVTSFKGA